MTLHIRPASVEDAAPIGHIFQVSGLDDTPDLSRIARLIPLHTTLVADYSGQVVGFIDVFTTIAQDGSTRLEIDLLGVDPAFQGRGIARRLIRTAIEASVGGNGQSPISLARALIRTSNLASRRSFAACGFEAASMPYHLYTNSPADGTLSPNSSLAHFIPVETLTYSGIWVEGELSRAAFDDARVTAFRHGMDTVGVLIRADDLMTLRTAEQAGYQHSGEFDWWELR